MTDRIEALVVRLEPEAVCDSCVAERLSLDSPELARQHLHELAGSRGLMRGIRTCSLCGTEAITTRKVRR